MTAGQRSQPAAAPRAAAPKPRPMLRPNGIFHGKTRAEVIATYEKCKWAGIALDLHLFRVAGGGAMGAWIKFVYDHSYGSNDSKERGTHLDPAGRPLKGTDPDYCQYTPVVHPDDAAKQFGLSPQMMREARNECVAKGFTPRKSRNRLDGKDFFRYSLDIEAMAHAPNAWDAQRSGNAREDAALHLKRKPPGSESGEKEANSFARVAHQASHENGESALALLPAGEPAIIAVTSDEVEVSHELPYPVAYTQKVTNSGRTRVHFSSPAPASGTVDSPAPYPGEAQPDAASGLASKSASGACATTSTSAQAPGPQASRGVTEVLNSSGLHEEQTGEKPANPNPAAGDDVTPESAAGAGSISESVPKSKPAAAESLADSLRVQSPRPAGGNVQVVDSATGNVLGGQRPFASHPEWREMSDLLTGLATSDGRGMPVYLDEAQCSAVMRQLDPVPLAFFAEFIQRKVDGVARRRQSIGTPLLERWIDDAQRTWPGCKRAWEKKRAPAKSDSTDATTMDPETAKRIKERRQK